MGLLFCFSIYFIRKKCYTFLCVHFSPIKDNMMNFLKRFSGSKTNDMTVGNPTTTMLAFALPIMISQIFQQLYNTADTYIVGKYLGTDALSAVSSSGTLIFFLIGFFSGTATGAGVVISRYFGANDKDRVSRAIHTDIVFGLICGAIVTTIGVTLTPTILKMMNIDEEIFPQAVEYFKYYFYGGIFLIMYNICCGIMNAVGDSRRPLFYLIFSSLLNIALDLLFVGVFRFGVWSAALATVISQAASVSLCFIHLMKKDHIYTVSIRKLKIHRDMIKEIIRFGLPSGVQNSVIAVANVLVQSQINFFGKYATGAYGIHAKIEGFAFVPINSFTAAISTFISQNLGARKYDRARKGARIGIISCCIIAETVGIICFTFSKTFVGFFDSNPEIIKYGFMQDRSITLFYFLLAFSHSIASVCRGAGKAFVPMFVMLGDWCAFRILYIEVVMHLFENIRLIYFAYPITWFISSVIFCIYYFKSDWIHGFDTPPRRMNIRKHLITK